MEPLAVYADPELGSGRVPLLLLHAFPLDSRMWDRVVAQLGPIPVLRVDAPGFGGSAPRKLPEQAGLSAFAADLLAHLHERGVERAVVGGLSMGGYVAMALAALAPDFIAGLALLSTKAEADNEAARERRLAMVAAIERGESRLALPMLDALLGQTSRRTRPDLVAAVQQELRATPPAGLAWAQRSMAARPDSLATLRDLSAVPGLVMRGLEDPLMSAAQASAIAQVLGTEVQEISDSGHLLAQEQPTVVAAALADLYQRAVN